MDIETLLRLAKKQSWWNAFSWNLKSVSPEKLAERAIENNNYLSFFSNAFAWKDTKEGVLFWVKVANDFCRIVDDYENSTPVFKAYEKKVLVARFIGWQESPTKGYNYFKDIVTKTLQENNIAFDLLVVDGYEIKAYKSETYFVRE